MCSKKKIFQYLTYFYFQCLLFVLVKLTSFLQHILETSCRLWYPQSCCCCCSWSSRWGLLYLTPEHSQHCIRPYNDNGQRVPPGDPQRCPQNRKPGSESQKESFTSNFLKNIAKHILKPFRFCMHSEFHLRPVQTNKHVQLYRSTLPGYSQHFLLVTKFSEHAKMNITGHSLRSP